MMQTKLMRETRRRAHMETWIDGLVAEVSKQSKLVLVLDWRFDWRLDWIGLDWHSCWGDQH